MLSNWDFFVFYRKNLKTQNIIFYSKILNLKQKTSQSKNFWNSWSMIFLKSMSHDFWKFMVHDFLKINVPRFFEIHSPRFFGIQCPKDFCDFGLFNRLAQAGGGGPYYMIFHYQKHSVLNYLHSCFCAWFIYSSDWSAYSAARKKVGRTWEYVQ